MKNAGRLDRLITRRIENKAIDDYGQPYTLNPTDSNMWAEVVYSGSASESMKAHRIFPQRDVVFIVRHPDPTGSESITGISQDDTILFEGREYDVLGFEEIGRRDGLRIYCKEKGTHVREG